MCFLALSRRYPGSNEQPAPKSWFINSALQHKRQYSLARQLILELRQSKTNTSPEHQKVRRLIHAFNLNKFLSMRKSSKKASWAEVRLQLGPSEEEIFPNNLHRIVHSWVSFRVRKSFPMARKRMFFRGQTRLCQSKLCI